MGRSWLRWLLVAATFALLLFVVLRHAELERAAQVLRGADWRWLPLALAAEASFQCNEATIYWIMYRMMGHRAGLGEVVGLTLAASFVNRVVPTAGVSGTTFFAERMARRGVPPAATVTVNVARYVLDYGAFMVVLGGGLVYLSTHHRLAPIEVRAAGTMGAVVLAGAAAMAFLVTHRSALGRLLSRLAGLANRVGLRLLRRPVIGEEAPTRFGREVASAMGLLVRARWRSAGLVAMGFLIHLFDLAGLFIVFRAVGYPVHLGVLTAGYGLAYLAGFVSVVPSGLGVFEASMTAVYVSLGIPLEEAVLVTLLYRFFSLWVPLLAGYLVLHVVVREAPAHGPSL